MSDLVAEHNRLTRLLTGGGVPAVSPVPHVDAKRGCRWARKLEVHLSSETDNDIASGPSARVRIILNNRLQQHHGYDIKQRIEFNTLLGVKWRCTRRNELLAEAVPNVADR